MCNTILPVKNGINSINILHTGYYKRILIYYCQYMKNFKSVCIKLNKVKLTRVIQMCKNLVAIKMLSIVLTFYGQDPAKDYGYIVFYV